MVPALAGDDDGRVSLLTADGTPLRTLEGTGGEMTALALSPDGLRLAAGDGRGRVAIWELEGNARPSIRQWAEPVTALMWVVGQSLWVASGSNLRRVEPGRDGELSLDAGGPVRSLAISADGQTVATLTGRGSRPGC